MTEQGKRDFLRLFSCALNGTEPEMSAKDIDFKELYQTSRAHNVASPVSFAVEKIDGVPESVKEAFVKVRRTTQQLQVLQDYYVGLISFFRKSGIRFMLLKGFVLKKLYPNEAMRYSCDIDILYDTSRKQEVTEWLSENGYILEHAYPKHDSYKKDALVFELHAYLFKEGFAEYLAEGFDIAKTDDGIEYYFSNEDMYLYSIAHAHGHFVRGINTLRSLSDIWILKKNYPDMDRKYIDERLLQMSLTKFEEAFSKLCLSVFGGEKADSETLEIEDYVVRNPIESDVGKSQLQTMSCRKTGSAVESKLILFGKRVFPTYKFMTLRYAWLKKAPFLYPYTILLRLIQVAFGLRGSVTTIPNELAALKNITHEEILTTERVKRLAGILK